MKILMLQRGTLQEQSEFSKKLLASFRKGDNDTVLRLLKEPEADIHAANENGTTLLHYAGKNRDVNFNDIKNNKFQRLRR